MRVLKAFLSFMGLILLIYLAHDFLLYVAENSRGGRQDHGAVEAPRRYSEGRPSALARIEEEIEGGGAPAPAKQNDSPPIIKDAPGLVNEYEANEVKADMLYKGRTMIIVGRVEEISKDLFNSPYLVLGPAYAFSGVQCMFTKDDEPVLAELTKGMIVGIRGQCAGKSFLNVAFRYCSFLPKKELQTLLYPPPRPPESDGPTPASSPPANTAGPPQNR